MKRAIITHPSYITGAEAERLADLFHKVTGLQTIVLSDGMTVHVIDDGKKEPKKRG